MSRKINETFISRLTLLMRELEDKLNKDNYIQGQLTYNSTWEAASTAIEKFFKNKVSPYTDTFKVSEETIRDYSSVLVRKKPPHAPNKNKLSLISCYLGYQSWDSFCQEVDNRLEFHSELFDVDEVNPKRLKSGQKVIIGWYPVYYILAEYLGNYKFYVHNVSRNIKRKPGDTFCAAGFKIEIPPVWSCNYEMNQFNQPINEDGEPILEKDLKDSRPKIKGSGVPRFLQVSLIPVKKEESL